MACILGKLGYGFLINTSTLLLFVLAVLLLIRTGIGVRRGFPLRRHTSEETEQVLADGDADSIEIVQILLGLEVD